MNQFKATLASKTVWMGILGVLAALPLTGKYLVGLDMGAVADTLSSAVIVVTQICSIIFRISANTQLVPSAQVAEVANNQVAEGVPPKEALVVAKAHVAARQHGRA